MKTYTLIFTILLSLFTILSCKNDDDNPTQQPPPHPIEGKWELLRKDEFLSSTFYTTDEVIWTFTKNNVEFEINIDEEDYIIRSMLFPFHIPGNYEYSINENQIHFELGYMPSEGYLNHPFHISNDTLFIGEHFLSSSDNGSVKYTFKRK